MVRVGERCSQPALISPLVSLAPSTRACAIGRQLLGGNGSWVSSYGGGWRQPFFISLPSMDKYCRELGSFTSGW
jgi:hypothetical protein